MLKVVHVVVGIVFDEQKRVLIALRPKHIHQGGLWEFPGGKVEFNETPIQALTREFKEELGISVRTAKPIKQFKYHYSDKSVLLDVWHIIYFTGIPSGVEGQLIQWLPIEALSSIKVPKANEVIVELLYDIHYNRQQLSLNDTSRSDCEARPINDGSKK